MKRKVATTIITLTVLAFLMGCAGLKSKLPGTGTAKSVGKKALTKPTVEVLEVKMEKTSMEKNALDNLVITGKAIYHPAKVGAKAFKDYVWDTRVEFYDAQGNKLPFHIDGLDCGEYGEAENVKPNKSFPFKGETGTAYIGMDNFTKAVSCKVTRFTAL